MGLTMMYRRIAAPRKKGGRYDLDNPGAMQPEDAERNLKQIQEKLGPEGWELLNTLLDRFHETRKKLVLSRMVESGLISEEMHEQLEEANQYARFQYLHHMSKNQKSLHSIGENSDVVVGGGTFQMYKQVGSWEAIDNPFLQTISQDLSILWAASTNKLKTSMVDFLEEVHESPELIREPGKIKKIFMGTTPTHSVTELTPKNHLLQIVEKGQGRNVRKHWEPVDPDNALKRLKDLKREEERNQNPDLEKIRSIDNTIKELDNGPDLSRRAAILLNVKGKTKYYYIDKEVAASIKHEPWKTNKFFEWTKILGGFTRELIINKNPKFIAWNAFRDPQQTWLQYPEFRPLHRGGFLQLPLFFKLLGQSYKTLWQAHRPLDTFNKIDKRMKTEELKQLRRDKILAHDRPYGPKDLEEIEKIATTLDNFVEDVEAHIDFKSDAESETVNILQLAHLADVNDYYKKLIDDYHRRNPGLKEDDEAARKHWLVRIPGLAARSAKKLPERFKEPKDKLLKP